MARRTRRARIAGLVRVLDLDPNLSTALRAEVVDGHVRVLWDFGQPIPACRPSTIVIGIATSTGPEYPLARRYRVSDSSGTVEIDVPDYWTSWPDTVYAGAETASGVAGPGTRVRIR